MPARSSAVLLLLGLASCDPPAPSAAVVVAPRPIDYTCAQQRQAAAELANLPPDSMLGKMMGDYGNERRQARTALALPEPKACSP